MEPQGSGIYKIMNQINGKAYIGQSICIKDRWTQHKNDAKNKNSQCYDRPLYRAIRKYGIENFEFSVLEECPPEELNEKEIYWIKYYDTFNAERGYNLTPGGHQSVKVVPKELYELWDQGFSIQELIKHFNVNHKTIDKWLKQCPTYSVQESFRRGYYKSKKYRKSIGRFFNKRICQYTLKGEIVRYWRSIREIGRAFDSQSIRQGVAKCLVGKYYSSYGFRWGYEGEELVSQDKIKSKSKGVKLTPEDVKNIKEMLAQGVRQQKIADKYCVHRDTITKINNGKHWRDEGAYPIYNFKKKKSNR